MFSPLKVLPYTVFVTLDKATYCVNYVCMQPMHATTYNLYTERFSSFQR